MKKIPVVMTVVCAMAALAAAGDNPAPAARAAAKSSDKAASRPAGGGAALQIPKDAQRVDASTWRWVDGQGVAWIYRQTPFGINHYKEQQPQAAAAPVKEPVKVTDLGASYRFERATPFGNQTWEKSKSELNENEKRIVAGQQEAAAPESAPAPAAAQSGSKAN